MRLSFLPAVCFFLSMCLSAVCAPTNNQPTTVQLNVATGVEFIAARKALIEQLQKEQQAAGAAALASASATAAAAAAGDGADAASGAEQQPAASETLQHQQQETQQEKQQQQRRTWLSMCVAADRSVMATLMGLWGALGPWKRLELLCGVAWMLIWKVSTVWL